MAVLMLGMAAYLPQMPQANSELRKPKSTPTPQPTATASSNQLTALVLISPAYRATESREVTLVWSAVTGAARYHVQAGLNTYFDEQSNIIDRSDLTSTRTRSRPRRESSNTFPTYTGAFRQ